MTSDEFLALGEDKINAFINLVILLPPEHRDTLKVFFFEFMSFFKTNLIHNFSDASGISVRISRKLRIQSNEFNLCICNHIAEFVFVLIEKSKFR